MRRVWRLAFIAVPVVWVAVAHVAPLLAIVRVSLLEVFPAPPDAQPSYSLGAFAAFGAGSGYQNSLLHSLGLAASATVLSLLVAWPLAWHVALRVPAERRGLRLALLLAPFWTSEVVRIFALVLLLANRGALNLVLRWTGAAPLPLLYGTGSVMAGLVYTVLLSALLPVYAALLRLPAEVLDAAADLGAGPWRRQILVALPLAMDGVVAAAALTFLLCLGVLTAPALLGGAGTPNFAVLIAAFFGGSSGRWPLGAAFSLILLVAGTACAGGLAWGSRQSPRLAA